MHGERDKGKKAVLIGLSFPTIIANRTAYAPVLVGCGAVFAWFVEGLARQFDSAVPVVHI
ncbi:MAG: hypothetical protein KUG65_11595 [Sphingomonadaceae bacterium]|nr:hypothetical protein [Sphingomonadaceae bacterium]